jgi:hypothetical protein
MTIQCSHIDVGVHNAVVDVPDISTEVANSGHLDDGGAISR